MKRLVPLVVLSVGLSLVGEAHAQDLSSVVAKAREQVEAGQFAEALKTLAPLKDKANVPKALAIEAALLETTASVVAKGAEAAQAACARAVVLADYDPDVARELSPKVRSACKLAAQAERVGRLPKEKLTLDALTVDKVDVAWQPIRLSTQLGGATAAPAWLRVVVRLKSSALEGSFDLALAPSQEGPLRTTLDPSWARPGATLTIELHAQDKFGDLQMIGTPTQVQVPKVEAVLALGTFPANAKVTLDGAAAAPDAEGKLAVSPGSHSVGIELADGATANAKVEVPRGAVTRVALSPQKAGSGRPFAWITAGTALAAAATGLVLLVSADARRREIEEAAAQREPGSQLPATDFADLQSKDEERKTFTAVGAGMLVGAGVFAITATVLFAIPDGGGGAKKAARVLPLAAPLPHGGGLLGVAGSF